MHTLRYSEVSGVIIMLVIYSSLFQILSSYTMSSSDYSSTDSGNNHAKSWTSWKARKAKAAKVLASSRKREESSSTRKEASPNAAAGISMPALSSDEVNQEDAG